MVGWSRTGSGVGEGRVRRTAQAQVIDIKVLSWAASRLGNGTGNFHGKRKLSPSPCGRGWGEGFHAIFGRLIPSPQRPPARGGGEISLFVALCEYRTDREATPSAPAAKPRSATNPMDEWAYNFISRPIKNPSRPPRSGHIAGCVRATPAGVMASGRPGSSSRVNGSNRTPPRAIAA